MTLFNYRSLITFSLLFTSQTAFGEEPVVGSSLHQKQELAVSDIPAEVIQTINAARPNVNITGAEKELQHGNTVSA